MGATPTLQGYDDGSDDDGDLTHQPTNQPVNHIQNLTLPTSVPGRAGVVVVVGKDMA